MDLLSWMAIAISAIVGIPLIAIMLGIFIDTLSTFGKPRRYQDEDDAYVVMEDGTVRFDTGG